MEKGFKGFSSSTLKLIAVITMILDHFGAAIYENMPGFSYDAYISIRLVGRMAFPIYCFLLVEGFFLTRNIKKYIGRCFLFALISEIPFDMAFHGQFFYWEYQNVFFSLTVGLCVLYGISLIDKLKQNIYVKSICKLACIAAGAAFAFYTHMDYGYFGILAIVIFYIIKVRNISKIRGCIAGTLMFMCAETLGMSLNYISAKVWGIAVLSLVVIPLTFVFVYFYNGKRGLRMKYFFYLVYPVHLLIYGLIRMYVL